MIMIFFHIQHLFLYRLPVQLRHACQHCSGRVAARMCVNRQKLSRIYVHTAASLNLDGRTATDVHTDSKNLANGLCCVAVFGYFDHTKSAQFAAMDAKVVIELSRGDIIFFPSAIIRHRNLSLALGEERYSMVFYSAGGLFRWLDVQHSSNAGQDWRTKCSIFQTRSQLVNVEA